MFYQLKKYNNSNTLLKTVLDELFDQVSEDRKIGHYFFEISHQEFVFGVFNYSHFLMNRPDNFYRGTPSQKSEKDIQVTSTVFEEIHKILVKILTENEINDDDIPRLSFDIMEIIEECRAQFRDTNAMILNADSISNDGIDTLNKLFIEYKIKTKVAGRNALILNEGSLISIPIIIRLRPKYKTIVLTGKASSIDNTNIKDLEEIVLCMKEKNSFFDVKPIDDDDDWPFLLSEKDFSYEKNIPVRLLFRLIEYFSSSFSLCLQCDKQKILRFNN
tara:strand:+ start:243 stop:1064 length:822 start_codon:yes stop_codon:yes gene_type:complete